MIKKSLLTLSAITLLTSACQKTTLDSKFQINTSDASGIRTLDADERSADFDQLLQLFKTYYGPYQYKENRFGMNIEKMIVDLKEQSKNAKTDEEFMGYLMQVSANLQDGHVQFQIENSASNIFRYKIPIMLSNIEGKAIVAAIADDLSKWSGIKVGDEVLTVDDKKPQDILNQALKYRKSAIDLSNQQLIIYTFLRPSYMTDIKPHRAEATVKVKHENGSIETTDIAWESERYADKLSSIVRPEGQLDMRVPFADDFNTIVPGAHRGQMGQVEPIFLNARSQAKYKFVRIYPTVDTMKKNGLNGDEKPGIYAALYKYNGKTVLLLRSSTYSPSDYKTSVYMKYYRSIIAEYQDLADVMVLDQTHNPGGSFCASFYNLFAKEGDVGGVEYVRSDRKWINDLFINWPAEVAQDPSASPWDVKQLFAWGTQVEAAYDQKKFLAEPFPLFTGSVYAQAETAVWTKPVLVLIDELAGSCGDIFPMLVKANKRAQLFGQRTMGLGGNVEQVGQLNNSRVIVRMTRGLFLPFRPDGAYQTSEFIENNGVAPDIEYAHSVRDFRAGFVDYIKQFSDKATALQ